MVGKICLYNNDDLLFGDTYNLYTTDRQGLYDYVLDICTDFEKSFDEILKGYNILNNSIEEFMKFDNLDGKNNSLYKDNYNKGKELLENSLYLEFDMNIEGISQYLERNPLLKTKKIILSRDIEYDYTTLNKLRKYFKNYDNLYFSLPDNSKLIDYFLFEKTTIKLMEIVKEVKRHHFSPMETIMYVYDLVRERVYHDVDEGEDLSLARDLTSALMGEKIVCTGFIRIFNKILNLLGFKTYECLLCPLKDDIGHIRSEIYVKDPKYNLDGVYYFDPTYDSRKRNSSSYLYSYRFFARTKKEMDKIDGDELIDINFQCYNDTMVDEFYNLYKKSGFDNIPRKLIDSINHMAKVIDGKALFSSTDANLLKALYPNINIDKLYQNLIRLSSHYDKEIYADTMLQILFNVRKEQNKVDGKDYPFSIYDFYLIVGKSNWMFYNRDDLLLKAIFSNEYKTNNNLRMQEYLKNTGMDKIIVIENFNKKLIKKK